MVPVIRMVMLALILSAAALTPVMVPAQSNVRLLKDINPDQDEISGPSYFANLNGTLFFAAVGGGEAMPRLWKSSGTSTGTVKVLDSAGLLIGPMHLYPFDGYVYFAGSDGQGGHGMELWRSNGTTAGTAQVKDINPGMGSSVPYGVTAMGNRLYFGAIGSTSEGIELWKTDGTSAGTVLVKNIDPAENWSSAPKELTACGSLLFFTAETGDVTRGQMRQRELWVTDGTASGTKMVKDIGGAGVDGDVKNLIAYNNRVYFSANDPVHGVELWCSDGTAGGTVLVKDISSLESSSYPASLTVFNGKLYFTASADGGFHPEIYCTDGTSGGTALLYNFENDGRPDYGPQELCAVGNALFFTALHQNQTTFFSYGYELYKSSGSPGSAALVKDINTTNGANIDENGSGPVFFKAIEGKLYFVANDRVHGFELWVSNGTGSGTKMIHDINPGGGDGIDTNHFEIIQCGAQVYFNAMDGAHGNEIWTFSLQGSSGARRIADFHR